MDNKYSNNRSNYRKNDTNQRGGGFKKNYDTRYKNNSNRNMKPQDTLRKAKFKAPTMDPNLKYCDKVFENIKNLLLENEIDKFTTINLDTSKSNHGIMSGMYDINDNRYPDEKKELIKLFVLFSERHIFNSEKKAIGTDPITRTLVIIDMSPDRMGKIIFSTVHTDPILKSAEYLKKLFSGFNKKNSVTNVSK